MKLSTATHNKRLHKFNLSLVNTESTVLHLQIHSFLSLSSPRSTKIYCMSVCPIMFVNCYSWFSSCVVLCDDAHIIRLCGKQISICNISLYSMYLQSSSRRFSLREREFFCEYSCKNVHISNSVLFPLDVCVCIRYIWKVECIALCVCVCVFVSSVCEWMVCQKSM